MPSEELTKEVFAYFGRAYYFSECLHRELCNGWVAAMIRKVGGTTRPRAEELLLQAYRQTMGQILREVESEIPPDLLPRLDACVESRNFLAHHFWFERVSRMSTDEGLLELRDELDQFAEMFSSLNDEATAHFDAVREVIGLTPEALGTSLEKVLADTDARLPTRRFLQKQETLTRAWDAPVGEGSTLIFETDDGELWQLCDAGLGWSPFVTRGSDWRENDLINRHLPAKLNPRPRGAEPWDYELPLRAGALLWVRKTDQKFRWGIRIHSRR